jgi:hypothetical protein
VLAADYLFWPAFALMAGVSLHCRRMRPMGRLTGLWETLALALIIRTVIWAATVCVAEARIGAEILLPLLSVTFVFVHLRRVSIGDTQD